MLRSLCVTAVLAAAAPAQTTWIVGPGGNFTNIGVAIAAAQPGDIILVRAGVYTGFTLSKGVRVLGDPGAMVNSIGIVHVVIENVPAGETAVVRGLGSTAAFGTQMDIRNNQGHVHVEAMDVSAALTITNSAQVSLAGVTATNVGTSGLPNVSVQSSTLSAVHCSFQAAQSPAGLTITTSDVVLADTTCIGHVGLYVPAGPGIALQSGALTITGNANTLVAAGVTFTSGSPAIETTAGTIRIDPQVQLLPSGTEPKIGGPATVVFAPVARVDATVSSRQLTTTLYASGAQLGWILAGPALHPPIVLPFGQLWLGTANLVLDGGAIPAQGSRTVTVSLPMLDPGTLAVFEGIVVRNGAVELSAPNVTTIAP